MAEMHALRNHDARRLVALAGILGATGVALGAFGAHGLEAFLQQNPVAEASWLARRLDQFDVGVRYQLLHAVALLGLASLGSLLSPRILWITISCWVAGIGLFSGMLYLLVLSNTPILGAIVPIGGVLLIGGWVTLVIGAWRGTTSGDPGDFPNSTQ
jgi:uncharacterized membrane protein YgdD (TMEM256/DUF423 family)